MATQIANYHFNSDEYHRMAAAGIFSEDDRVELIEGEIVEMSPIGARHAACVDRISALLNRYVGQAAIVRVQSPIRLGHYSEPQPDVALLRHRDDFYAGEHPGPGDIMLVIEVADTSQEYDRNVKLPLYARAEIAEYWLVDLSRDSIEVYEQPSGSTYISLWRATRGDSIPLRDGSGAAIPVEHILG